jgi:hypothetical protein
MPSGKRTRQPERTGGSRDCELCGKERTRGEAGKDRVRVVAANFSRAYRFWREAGQRYEQDRGGRIGSDCLYFEAESWIYSPLTNQGGVSVRKRNPTLQAGLMFFKEDEEWEVKTYYTAFDSMTTFGPSLSYPVNTKDVRFWKRVERQLAFAPEALFENYRGSDREYKKLLKRLNNWPLRCS